MSDDVQAKIGLLTDLHYDGSPEARERLCNAVATLSEKRVTQLLLLGDLANGTEATECTERLGDVAQLCGAFNGPIHYLHGNHDLDALTKAEFYKALGRTGAASRFTFTCGGVRFIALDGCFSPDGKPYDCGNFEWKRSFVPPEELGWLRAQLAESVLPCVVVSHQRLDGDSVHCVENAVAVQEVITESGRVAAVFQGHNHVSDRRKIGDTTYYTLAAHVDGAIPQMIFLSESTVSLHAL